MLSNWRGPHRCIMPFGGTLRRCLGVHCPGVPPPGMGFLAIVETGRTAGGIPAAGGGRNIRCGCWVAVGSAHAPFQAPWVSAAVLHLFVEACTAVCEVCTVFRDAQVFLFTGLLWFPCSAFQDASCQHRFPGALPFSAFSTAVKFPRLSWRHCRPLALSWPTSHVPLQPTGSWPCPGAPAAFHLIMPASSGSLRVWA